MGARMLEPIRLNPSLRNLSGFIGHWDADLVFPADPPGKLSGKVVFDWMDNGAFLVMRSETEGDGPPKALAVIGCDDSSGAYSMLYYDARGVSRIYAMTYADGAWSLDGKPRQFFQRFRGRIDEDSRHIRGSWEKSQDGQCWQHDFSVTYRKRG
jgi:hypothetical protein